MHGHDEPQPNPAATLQPPPVRNASPDIVDLVVRDLQDRAEAGLKKYGVKLQANNGRDAEMDEYQELLDQVMYRRQRMEERRLAAGVNALTNEQLAKWRAYVDQGEHHGITLSEAKEIGAMVDEIERLRVEHALSIDYVRVVARRVINDQVERLELELRHKHPDGGQVDTDLEFSVRVADVLAFDLVKYPGTYAFSDPQRAAIRRGIAEATASLLQSYKGAMKALAERNTEIAQLKRSNDALVRALGEPVMVPEVDRG